MTEMEEVERKQLKVHRRASLLVTILLVLLVLLCLYVAIQVLSNGYVNFGGYMLFRVVTGSMEPTVPTGALLVTKQVDIQTVEMGDIVCFQTQEAAIWGKIVTHRVVEVLDDGSGSILLRTKGDANLTADGYLVTQDNFIGKVIWHTADGSTLASILSFFTSRVGFLCCIVMPCLLMVSLILKNCASNIRREIRGVLDTLETPREQEDPLCDMTQQEYEQMYERIRAELMEELLHCVEIPQEDTTE